jgi:sugar phosphate isomerase/epimerase
MNHPIAFSTLACPEWGIQKIISEAEHYGYNGIEWRGGHEGHVQPEMSREMIRMICQQMDDHGLFSLAITAYTSFVSPDKRERLENLDALKSYLNLAAEIGAGNVRVFLGELPAGTSVEAAHPLIADCLLAALELASTLGVTIAIEPHDDFVRSTTIVPVLEGIVHDRLKVIWDVGNTYAAGEAPEVSFPLLLNRIAYLHIKDGRRLGAEWQLCPLGQGEVPLSKIFNWLVNAGFNGAVSIEWERAWHPELDPPELALPAGLHVVQSLWSRN